MEVGGVNRPAVTSSQATLQRVDPPASSGFARTQLSRDESVQPVEKSSAVRFEPSEGSRERAALDSMMQRAIQRTVDIDERTRNVVFRATNERTGQILMQLPSEQALKLRAYLRETTAAAQEDPAPETKRSVRA